MAKKVMRINKKTGKIYTQKVHDKRGSGGRYARSLWTSKGRRARYVGWKRKKYSQTHTALRNASVLGGVGTTIMGVAGAPILLTIGVFTLTVVLGVSAWNTRHWA